MTWKTMNVRFQINTAKVPIRAFVRSCSED